MKMTIYRNYRFIDKDPIIDALRTVVKSNEKLTNGRAATITGVAAGTLENWFDGGTRKPQNATVTQVSASLGYVRRDELKPDGQVVVGFVKARRYDYAKEIEKQADWLLKQGKKKRPTKRKTNGK
jgi:hypothetical protein